MCLGGLRRRWPHHARRRSRASCDVESLLEVEREGAGVSNELVLGVAGRGAPPPRVLCHFPGVGGNQSNTATSGGVIPCSEGTPGAPVSVSTSNSILLARW